MHAWSIPITLRITVNVYVHHLQQDTPVACRPLEHQLSPNHHHTLFPTPNSDISPLYLHSCLILRQTSEHLSCCMTLLVCGLNIAAGTNFTGDPADPTLAPDYLILAFTTQKVYREFITLAPKCLLTYFNWPQCASTKGLVSQVLYEGYCIKILECEKHMCPLSEAYNIVITRQSGLLHTGRILWCYIIVY